MPPRLNYCADCGTRIAPQATRCKPCWGLTKRGVRRGEVHACVDCGKELPRSSQARRREDGRCWDCYVKWLDARPHKVCSVPGCGKPHEAKGLCRDHYKASMNKSAGGPGRSNNKVHRWTQAQPCQVCGYDRLPSQVHRINPALPYVSGNVSAACSRCHAEITAGITPSPPPLRIPWL